MADKSGYGGYAVGWVCLALINTNIAQLKGAGGLLWGLLSLLLGPIATFILVFVGRGGA
jgi:hypothetical protein